MAARRNHETGDARRLHRRAREDRARRRAAHHALAATSASAPPTTSPATRCSACCSPGADPVRKISIVPRGRALGVTFQAPDADRYGYDDDYLRGRIIGALGGRAAEEIVYGDVTTGAENDLEQVTRIARQMVGRWGMSEAIGPVSVLPRPGRRAAAVPGVGRRPSAAHPGARRRRGAPHRGRLLREAPSTLREHRDQLEALAQALLERETLDEADAYRAAGIERDTAPGDRPPHGMLKEPSVPNAPALDAAPSDTTT